jgi:hypothetical protein
MAKKRYMREERFELLLSSAKEAVLVSRGKKKAARRTVISTWKEKLESPCK